MKGISTKSKWMIFSSLAVSVALIATLVINMAAGSWEKDGVFVIGLIAMAAAVFAGTIIVRVRKGRYVKALNSEFYQYYEKISDALKNAVMSRAEIKETKEDIAAMLLDAQVSGRRAQDVAGSDTQAFVRRIQASFGYRNGFVFQLLSVVQYGIFFMLLMQLLIFFKDGGLTGFFSVTIQIAMFVMFLLVICVIYPLTKNAMRKDKSVLPFVLPFGFGVAYIAMMILVDNIAGNEAWARAFLDNKVPMISSWVLLAVLIAALLGFEMVKILLRRASIRRLREAV